MTAVALNAQTCAGMLRALADDTRLRILVSLLAGTKCVTDLTRELRRGQPHISHHLRILRDAGLVIGMRDGKRVCYRVSPTVQKAMHRTRRRALDFGCCQISFPQPTLVTPARSAS
jgi:DNA-binding transcriptional ArsR family regulator